MGVGTNFIKKCSFSIDLCHDIMYNIIKVKELINPAREKMVKMEEMNTGELLVQQTRENTTRKILEILNESKDLEEAKQKVKDLLK